MKQCLLFLFSFLDLITLLESSSLKKKKDGEDVPFLLFKFEKVKSNDATEEGCVIPQLYFPTF